MKRDLLRLTDLSRAECETLFALAVDLKGALKSGKPRPLLQGKTLAMIFEKPSLRTRISFETGMSTRFALVCVALRTRVSISAIGSVIMWVLLSYSIRPHPDL